MLIELEALRLANIARNLELQGDNISLIIAGSTWERIRAWCRSNSDTTSAAYLALPRGYQLVPPA